MYLLVFLCMTSFVSASSVSLFSVAKGFDDDETVVDTFPSLKLQKNSDTFYYFGTIFKGNYYQATQFCNYHDMKLLSIESLEENIFLFEKLKNIVGTETYIFWTSGTSLVQNSRWVWLSTGEIVSFHNWLPNQPDNAGNNEKCLEVKFVPKTHKSLVWNDNNCAQEGYTICETSLPTTVSKILKNHLNSNFTLIDVRSQ